MTGPVWLQTAFRPFFLLAGLYAGLSALGWVAILRGSLAPPPALPATWWHAHEMLFGVVAAAAAGFLLTAFPVWTNAQRPSSRLIAALVALWLAGRVVMWAGAFLPAATALVELAFLPAVVAALAPALLRARSRRNAGFPVLLAALFLADLGIHASALGIAALPAPQALRAVVALVAVLILVIGGRITPSFTRNALRRSGVEPAVHDRPVLARTAIAAAVVLAALEAGGAPGLLTGAAALVAGLAAAGRLAGWESRRTLRDPLLWSLHAGYAWVAAGLLLTGLADWGAPIPEASGLHALTAGAMGGEILAVAMRVPLGHTGRPLVAPRGATAVLAAVHGGALLRVLLPAVPAGLAPSALGLAGVLWGSAFLAYAALYAPILLRPRVDGRAG